MTSKIHIFDTENKQKLNIIKANLYIQKKYAHCNTSKQMCQTKKCTTHQTAGLEAQIKDFPVFCSTLLHRTGPYAVHEITAVHRSLSNTISCVIDRIRFLIYRRPTRIASERHEVPTAGHDVRHWRNIYFRRCYVITLLSKMPISFNHIHSTQ